MDSIVPLIKTLPDGFWGLHEIPHSLPISYHTGIHDALRYASPVTTQLDISRLEHYSRFVRELSITENNVKPATLEYLAPHVPSDFYLLPRARILKLHPSSNLDGFDMLFGPALVEIDIQVGRGNWESIGHSMSLLTRMCTVCTNLEALHMDMYHNGSSFRVGTFMQVVQSMYPRLRTLHLSADHDSEGDRCDPEFTSKPISDLLRTTCSRAQEFSSVKIPVPADGIIQLATNPNLRDVTICLDATELEPRLFKGIHRPFCALRAMRFSVEHLDERSLSFVGNVSSRILTRLIIDVEDADVELDSTMLHAHILKLQQVPFRDTLTLFGLDFEHAELSKAVGYEALEPLFDLPHISRLFLRRPSDELVRTIAEKQPHIKLIDQVS
ncbi:hypothetical protein POSPLADRAFT_1156508 [Postia placenta MAD-698-R-SB12]|uniref:F-box domain-containing protein n=1 Tax=Postia placenta MAD-698-R-SB12 TaxID=670580 RepID=A0A1X6MLX5_9APHY|nr:hypothetical protein POSPLADRAFT_1156508 [Postia placenta MAD-698-R-SB12]OSX57375.1 hypothetical protein POSPLADRAFT_1156508 [Postia placenta MAD-698-R-SB12]